EEMPALSGTTYLRVSNARAALAALDATAKELPNPRLFRTPALQREAQSTSALEGTYAPLSDVYAVDEAAPGTPELVEVLNYVTMADRGFAQVARGQSLSAFMLSDLQGMLMNGTRLERDAG